MNPISAAKSLLGDDKGISVDTEVVVGDKEEHHRNQVGHEQTAETIQNIVDTSPLVLFLLILGWVLPTPVSMAKSLWKYLTFRRKK